MSLLIFFCIIFALLYFFKKFNKLNQKTDQLSADIAKQSDQLHHAIQQINMLTNQLNKIMAQATYTHPESDDTLKTFEAIKTTTSQLDLAPKQIEIIRELIKKRINIYAQNHIQNLRAQSKSPTIMPPLPHIKSNQDTYKKPFKEASNDISKDISKDTLKNTLLTPDIKIAKETTKQQGIPEPRFNWSAANVKHEPKCEKPVSTSSSMPYYVDEPSVISIWFKKALTWFLEGNPLAKLGICILFIGFGFLLKLGIEKNIISIELRLLMTAIISTSLFIIGWYLRFKNKSFALAMQGGGLGGLYFITYAAYKFFNVLPYEFTMICMLGICALIVFFAILQAGESLAFLALLGGFSAPILMSTGTGTFVQLFGFYTILSLGIITLLIRFNWRSLQMLGVFMIFGICAGIGFILEKYDPSQFIMSQIYLIINFFLYGIVLIIINRIHVQKNNQGILNKYLPQLSVGLLFGVPLTGFAIEYGIIQHIEYGAAIAALILGFIYIIFAYIFYKGITYKNFTIDLTAESYFFRALGAGFITLSVPLAFSLHFTSIAWTIEGCILLLLNHRQIPKITYILGTLLVASAAILSLDIISINTGRITLNNFNYYNNLIQPITNNNLVTWAINTLALMICSWRWMTLTKNNSNTVNIQVTADIYPPTVYFKPYAQQLSTIFLMIGISMWIFVAFQASFSIWSKTIPFNPQIYSFLSILSISALIWHGTAKQFEWDALFNTIFVFFGLGIVITAHLMTLNNWTNAGMLNLTWFLIISITIYLCYDYLNNKFKYDTLISSTTLLWSLCILNKLLVPYVDLAHLFGVQSLILALLFTRYPIFSKIFISPQFLLYLATVCALLSTPLYYFNHSVITLTDIFNVCALNCIVFYLSYIWQNYAADDNYTHSNVSSTLNPKSVNPKYTESNTISYITLVIGGVYLSFTLFNTAHYFNQFFDNAHFISIGLFLTTALIPLTNAISNLCRWNTIRYIQIIGLIALIVALITQFSWIQLEFKNNLSSLTSVYIWQSIAIIISLMTHYYANSTCVLPKLIIQLYHSILGACVIFAGINLGYFLSVKYNMADSQLIYLTIFSILLIGFNFIYHNSKSLNIVANIYEFGLIGGLSVLTFCYLLICFFKAPIPIFDIYLPLLNPLEIILCIALFGLYLSLNQPLLRPYHKSLFNSFMTDHSIKKMIFINIILLMIINLIIARAISMYFNVEWNFNALWQSKILQACISLIWTSFALVMMIKSKQENSMNHWIAGAFPLLLVIIKLFLVDSAKGGGMIRAMLFVIIALFVIAISYYAPPPLRHHKNNLK